MSRIFSLGCRFIKNNIIFASRPIYKNCVYLITGNASQHIINCRKLSTSALLIKPNIVGRLKQMVGLDSRNLIYKKSVLKMSGLRLYLCCAELVDYDLLLKELALPDTLHSWFRMVELHIWLCMVRLAQEGRDGQVMRNWLVANMWQDIDKRSRKLGQVSMKLRKESLAEMAAEFRSALYAYDEGILSNDMVLAGALWRTIFDRLCEDPRILELTVQYVRKQMCHLDGQLTERILQDGLITFLPLFGDKVDKERTIQILMEIQERTK